MNDNNLGIRHVPANTEKYGSVGVAMALPAEADAAMHVDGVREAYKRPDDFLPVHPALAYELWGRRPGDIVRRSKISLDQQTTLYLNAVSVTLIQGKNVTEANADAVIRALTVLQEFGDLTYRPQTEAKLSGPTHPVSPTRDIELMLRHAMKRLGVTQDNSTLDSRMS